MPDKTFAFIIVWCVFVLLTARGAARWALRRPAFLAVLTAAVVAAGLICLKSLPVELMPHAATETMTVTVNVRGGMAPQDVETLIARPLEDALGDLPRLRTLFTSAKKDRCVVSLDFEPGADMNAAAGETHERVERTIPKLPPEIEKPSIARYEESDAPVYIAAMTSRQLSPEQMRGLVDRHLKDQLLRAPGVANVEVGGGRESKILVEVDRDRLLAYQLPVQRIVSVLGKRNAAVQVGTVDAGSGSLPIRLVGTIKSLEEMKKIVVSRDAKGGTVLLEDVARVADSYLEPESLSRLNGRSAVSLYVQKESAANTLRTAQGIEEQLREAWAEIPASLRKSMEFMVVSNQAVSIREAMASVRVSLIFGVLLVVLMLGLAHGRAPLARWATGGGLAVLAFLLLLTWAFRIPQARMEIPLVLFLLIAVAFVFLYPDARQSLLVAAAIPLSVLLCLILLKVSGLSLNLMSLFGLALGIGLLVDNAILVHESLARESPLTSETAVRACQNVLSPLVGSTLATAVAFSPLLFLSHDVQRLYGDVAASVGASLFSSLAVSLTVIPALALRMKNGAPFFHWQGRRFSAQASIDRWTGWRKAIGVFLRGWFTRMESVLRRVPSGLLYAFPALLLLCAALGQKGPYQFVYGLLAASALIWGSAWAWRQDSRWEAIMGMRFRLVGGALALCLGALGLFWALEKDFQPAGEKDEFVIFVELSSGVKLSVADAIAAEMEDLIHNDARAAANIETLVSRVEGWSSKIYVTLKPRGSRPLSTEKVIALLREKLKDAGRDRDDNAFVHFSSPRSADEMVVQVAGPDYAVLESLAGEVAAGLEKTRGFVDVKLRYRPGRPEVVAHVDPDKADRHHLTAEAVVETVHALMRGLRATLFRREGRQIETIVRLRMEDRENLAALADIPLFNRQDGQLRLGHLARLEMSKMPNEIFRENKQRIIQVSANRHGLSLGKAAEEAFRVIDGIAFPPDYFAALAGGYRDMARTLRQMAAGVLFMALAVFLLLVVLFESLKQALVVLAAVPLCLIGAGWGLAAFNMPVSPGALVGLMLLGGVVVNKAILIMDHFRENAQTADVHEKLRQAVQAQRRPVLLITLSTVLAFLPMLLDPSESGALWRPFSVVLVFGVLSSALLTLLVVPCLASMLMSRGERRDDVADS